MWLDDADELDPDSAEGRALMMQALLEAEEGCASPFEYMPLQPVTVEANNGQNMAHASGHSYHYGPPSLFCSVPWGMMLLREADPEHPALSRASAALAALDSQGDLTVHVDWGGLTPDAMAGPVSFAVRRGGAVVATAEGVGPRMPLSVMFNVKTAAPGEIFVAILSWPGGTRHLHCMAPLTAPVRLDGLLVAPSATVSGAGLPTGAALLAEDRLTTSLPLAYHPSRGLGIEMELITFAPEPALTGVFTKEAEVHLLLSCIALQVATAQEEHDEVALVKTNAEGAEGEGREEEGVPRRSGEARSPSALHSLLARCGRWTHEVDDHVMFSANRIARRVVTEEGFTLEGADHTAADAASGGGLLLRLHGGGKGTMKSEFKSPPPSEGALNFSNDGAAEIACFVRILRHMGAGASALSATGNSGSSLHVHVNVRDTLAGGEQLTCEELLAVYFAWVRFDFVTTRFARPWMWREPSMAPLYATGSEFVWREKAWEQGSTAAALENRGLYDIPTFARAVRKVRESDGFGALSEAEKIEALFGRDSSSPSAGIGRYCSLNLRRLTTYGTLEFRRFQVPGPSDACMRPQTL